MAQPSHAGTQGVSVVTTGAVVVLVAARTPGDLHLSDIQRAAF